MVSVGNDMSRSNSGISIRRSRRWQNSTRCAVQRSHLSAGRLQSGASHIVLFSVGIELFAQLPYFVFLPHRAHGASLSAVSASNALVSCSSCASRSSGTSNHW